MDDGKIIGLLYERNEKGLAEIQSKYGRELLALAERITGSREDAEEVVNDTLSAVWASIPPAFPDPLSSYVLRIVRNLSCKRVRFRNAEKRKSGIVSYEEIIDELADSIASDGDGNVDEGIITQAVNELLAKESPQNRTIFMRRYFYADSVKHISSLTGMTRAAVTLRLSRMRGRLHDLLTEKGIQI